MGTPQALTVGEIAKQLDWPIHRVDYFIRSRGIKCKMRAGQLRVFPKSIVARLQNERGRGQGGGGTR